MPSKHTSPNKVKFLIQKLTVGKAPGYDLITITILKKLPAKTLITYIFNSMFRLSYFLLTWKLSTIILIPKSNKPKNLVTSYRPISLLPTLAKLFEKLILKRVRPIIQTWPSAIFRLFTKSPKIDWNWATKWRIKINSEKSVHVTFTLKKTESSSLYFYGSLIPNSTEVKYLGLTFTRD